MLAQAYEYALEDVPTQHLEEAFHRAVKSKRDNFPISAIDIRTAFTDMLPELAERARAHTAALDRQLMAGKGTLTGRMSVVEWKTRHNLPDEWQLGDPFPPESDLCGKPSPVPHGETREEFEYRLKRTARLRAEHELSVQAQALTPGKASRLLRTYGSSSFQPVGALAAAAMSAPQPQPQPQAAAKAAHDDPADLEF